LFPAAPQLLDHVTDGHVLLHLHSLQHNRHHAQQAASFCPVPAMVLTYKYLRTLKHLMPIYYNHIFRRRRRCQSDTQIWKHMKFNSYMQWTITGEFPVWCCQYIMHSSSLMNDDGHIGTSNLSSHPTY